MTRRASFASPLGTVRVVAEGDALVAVDLLDDGPLEEARDALLTEAVAQLADYFAGRRQGFALPLAPRGTPFEQRVWRALAEIPYGATTSYGALADQLGSVARAVGTANGKNPLAIVVPCHRVIGADGSLTGYAGGLARKQWLLRHEGALLA